MDDDPPPDLRFNSILCINEDKWRPGSHIIHAKMLKLEQGGSTFFSCQKRQVEYKNNKKSLEFESF